jgi:hypothetical protein
MAIKLNCSRCKKALRVKDELAGKKVRCPGCQQILVVPEPAHPSAEIEALAAAALSEQPAAPAPAAPAATIKFHCSYCDEEVQASAELAGRQMPCPSCTRIIKVPVPEKVEPKDWRKVDPRGPAAGMLKDAEKAPEGAWGSKTTASAVSRRALVEAEVIPLAQEPTPWGRYISRGLIAASLLAAVGFGGCSIRRYSAQQSQQNVLELALKSLPEGPAPTTSAASPVGLLTAEVYRAAGELSIRENQAKAAQDFMSKARARLMNLNADSTGRDLALIDLAVTQVDLGGDTAADLRGLRLDWDKAYRHISQTVRLINAAQARTETVQQVGRKLLAHGEGRYLALVPNQLNADKERAELTALAGLELIRAGEHETAKALAAPLLKPYEGKPAKKADLAKRPVLHPNMIALAVALDQPIETEAVSIPAPEAALKDPYPDIRLGYARGWAAQGKWAQARQIAAMPGDPAVRFEAFVDVATAADGKSLQDADAAARAALTIWRDDLQGSPISPWLLLRLVRAGSRAGLADQMQQVAESITDADIRTRARLEVVRSRLASLHGLDTDGLDKEPKQPSSGQILEAICRHNARYQSSSSLIREIDQWEPTLRALGYIGAALGQQDN